MSRVLALAVGLVTLAVLPPLTSNRPDILNLFFLILLYITLGQSWNVLGGFTGQVNLGHAAFFGIGVMVARQLWLAGHWPYPLAFVLGGIAATIFALVIGVPTFRLRGAYFSIGTLGLAEALRISVSNVFPNINALHQASFYAQFAFEPTWTFDAVLITFIGGVGTVIGPVICAIFYIFVREELAVSFTQFHHIIFGVLFILIVLLLPGGLLDIWSRVRGR